MPVPIFHKKKPGVKNSDSDRIRQYKGDDLFEDWIGPTIQRTDSEGNLNKDYERQIAALRREFQSHNAIKEVVNNWRDGLVGEPFAISLRKVDGDIADDDRAKQALADLHRWINFTQSMTVQMDPCLSTFDQSSVWQEFVLSLGVIGCAAIRVWQPERYAADPDPVKRVHVHVPIYGAIRPEYDNTGFLERIEYTYGDEAIREVHEYSEGQYSITVNDEQTVIESGRWRVFVIHAPSLITESAVDKQNAICHELTMLIRNQQHAGFRRRTLLNAEAPLPESEPLPVGPGIDEYQYGTMYGQPGDEKIANPSVHESQPFPVNNFLDSVGLFRELLYNEFSQGHSLDKSSSQVSGESRVQQRQNFDVLLRGWSERIEAAFQHVLTVVLEELGYDDLEAVVDLSITTGKLTGEERQQLRDDVNAGLLSKETAISLGGQVSDTEAELEKIAAERESESAMIVTELPNTPIEDEPEPSQE